MARDLRAAVVLGVLVSGVFAACGSDDDTNGSNGASAGSAGKGGAAGASGGSKGNAGGTSGGEAGAVSSGGAAVGGAGAEAGAGEPGGAAGAGGALADPTWSTPEPIDEAGDGEQSDVAVAPDGHACAVWDQSDGTFQSILAAVYDPASGWSAPELIDANDTANAQFPQVAITDAGVCLAVWQELGTYDVRGLWYHPGSGWETPVPFEVGAPEISGRPQVGFDADGNALVIWVSAADDQETTPVRVVATRYDTVDWSAAAPIEPANMGSASFPVLAVASDGYAVAAWTDRPVSTYDVRVARYAPGTGWAQPTTVENDAAAAQDIAAGIAPGGTVVVGWQQADTVWFSRYGSAWSTATPLAAASAFGVDVGVDSSGAAVLGWLEENAGEPPLSAWGMRMASNGTAGTAELLEEFAESATGDVKIAMTSGGTAVALWRQPQGTEQYLISNQFVPGSGWSGATVVEGSSAADVYNIGIASDGTAVAVFDRYDGVRYAMYATIFK